MSSTGPPPPSHHQSKQTAESTQDRVADDLAHKAFPDMARALRARIQPILDHWRRLSIKAMPHLDTLTQAEFENTIGEILQAAADALESADPATLHGVIKHGPGHGIDRFLQRFTLLDLFEEVRILRGVVIIEMAGKMGRALEVDEAATFHAIFDIIIQQGVMMLVEKQQQEFEEWRDAMRGANEQLLISSTRQQELAEQARQGKEAIRLNEERYRTLFSNMDEGYCIIEMIFDEGDDGGGGAGGGGRAVDYRFIHVNAAFERQSGLRNVVGRRMREFVGEIEEHWLTNYARVAQTGEAVRFANEYKSLGRWFDVNAFRADEWGPGMIAVLFRDITEAKRAEALLREQTRLLEHANADLLQFASAASHDLKEPLRGISTLARFISADDPGMSEISRQRLDRINVLCERLSQMVSGLIEHARTGVQPKLEQCDLDEIIGRIIDNSREGLREKGAEVWAGPDLPAIRADCALMERLFANLIANGIKFNESDVKRVKIFWETARHAIAVRDNGIGIPERYQANLFKLFKRLHDRDQFAGEGLGLALARRIVEAHGGRIECESEGIPGKGTTFYIHLPLAKEEDA